MRGRYSLCNMDIEFDSDVYEIEEEAWLSSEYMLKGFKNVRPHPVFHGPCFI